MASAALVSDSSYFIEEVPEGKLADGRWRGWMAVEYIGRMIDRGVFGFGFVFGV